MCIRDSNYSAGGAALFALAHRLLGGADWLERARALERFCRAHFDEQGLLYGCLLYTS